VPAKRRGEIDGDCRQQTLEPANYSPDPNCRDPNRNSGELIPPAARRSKTRRFSVPRVLQTAPERAAVSIRRRQFRIDNRNVAQSSSCQEQRFDSAQGHDITRGAATVVRDRRGANHRFRSERNANIVKTASKSNFAAAERASQATGRSSA